MSKMDEIVQQITPAPYTTSNDFRYFSELYAEYIGQYVSNINEIAMKHILNHTIVM